MTLYEELIKVIKTKNSWGKNELILMLALLLAKHTGELK